MVRNFTARRAGGSETALRSQHGSRFAALRGLRGQRPRCGLNLGDAKRHLGVPKESAVPPTIEQSPSLGITRHS